VQGVLLYLRLTGQRCVEFSLRANLELPGEFTGTESKDVRLWRCPPPDDLSNPNVRVYDGLFDLKTGDVEEIEQCLKSLNWLLAMVLFPYGATYSWRNKYRMALGATGLLQPTHEEMKTVGRLLKRKRTRILRRTTGCFTVQLLAVNTGQKRLIRDIV
jgi:hypothetical protein